MEAKVLEFKSIDHYNVTVAAHKSTDTEPASINVKVIDDKIAQRLDGITVVYETQPKKRKSIFRRQLA